MAKVCPHFETRDTPREAGARARRQAAKPTAGTSAISKSGKGKETSIKRRRREFIPNTYKFHALADYCSTIRRFGTTDNYNTQNVSHSAVKRTTYETWSYRASGSTSDSRHTMLAPTRTSLLGNVPAMNRESAYSEVFMPKRRIIWCTNRWNSTGTMARRTHAYHSSRWIHYLKHRLKIISTFLNQRSTVSTFGDF